LQLEKPAGGTGVGVEVISAPAADPHAVLKPVGPNNAVAPAAEKPAEAPTQVNDIKSGSTPAQPVATTNQKKPKADLKDESSSKKKKKKGISKLNPF
jgi:outer membrane protein assembly factor BamD